MRQLTPLARHELTAVEALADAPSAAGRPAVRVCMVQSLDGVAAIAGTSAPLGSDADRAFYLACRSLADIVLVGAGTARVEGYGPALLTPQLVVARQERGQPPLPRIALVSRSLRLDLETPFFQLARARPIVVTCAAAPSDLRRRVAEVADVIVAGDDDVDLTVTLGLLARDGCQLIGCEGGPTLNAAMLTAGLVDELCLSIAPILAGDGPRIAAPFSGGPHAFGLHAVLAEGDALFLRLRPTRPNALAEGTT